MAYVVLDDALGFIDLYTADVAGPGASMYAGAAAPTYGRLNLPGLELRAFDVNLGAGTFVFAKAVAAVTPGVVCEMTQATTNGRFDVSAQPWAGGTNTGKPLCSAVTTLAAGQWGWFQVQGISIVNVSGSPAAGNSAFWQSAGLVSATAVASKAMLNASFVSAPGVTIGTGSQAQVLSGTQALLLLNRPFGQGPIT